jgi:protease-4
MPDQPSPAQRVGRAFDAVRRIVLNLLFWGALVGLVVLAWRGRARVPSGAALVLDPQGLLVEQLSGRPASLLARALAGAPVGPSETLLADVLDAVRLGRDDTRIKALVLDLDGMSGGLSKLREVRSAIAAFKKSGKTVVAYSEQLGQRPFYVDALADELILHPQALVFFRGFGGAQPYFKEGLDRFGVRVHVFRVGEYKSAVEPFLRNDMSPEAKEADLALYGDLWRNWLAEVAEARHLEPDALRATIDGWPTRVAAAKGNLAQAALAAGFVDELAPRDRLRARMIELVGPDDDGHTYRHVGFRTFLAAHEKDRRPRGSGPGVAVVVARGEILDGTQPPGTIGGDSTAALVRRAREDDDAKAVVLRIDSPGGSVFASEVIRRECELVREAGKPLVVSMSSVAASGGYWIATSSDEIWASPDTITGSIGIFGIFPDVHETLARYLGVHLDGVGTTPWTDALDPGRPLDPAVAGVIQDVIDRGYDDFLERVGKARHMTRDQVDAIARGRVWSGEAAKRLGLLDELGDLQEAVASAAKRAKLAEGYRVFLVTPPLSLRDRLVRALLGAGASVGLLSGTESARAPSPLGRARASVESELELLVRWNDPRGAYVHCLCGEEWPGAAGARGD